MASPHPKKKARINGLEMAYVEVGEGDPIVFLHGNPTSSFLWRNIIPYLADQGRCIAPDLIGFGDSDKLPESGRESYRFVDHRDYLEGLLSTIGVTQNVTLVIHDWGGALGFDWANRHRDAVKAIAYMEPVLMPMTREEIGDIHRFFDTFKSDAGEEMILEKNAFIEEALPGNVMREMSKEEMDEYRRPFREKGEARRPTLTWPREIPLDGEPADVVAIMNAYLTWLKQSDDLPKLLIVAEPGAILTGERLATARTFPNQKEVTVEGRHFIQEDSPDEIGKAIAEWRRGLGP